ncbi:DUF29 domain-containing protein [Gloeothece verrucosa]|uniref:DUF29 domain-containing protein n=1 Tax=Gloeothece verrucosa (strain PCC 7822) TaxID=497965 RepID=E0U7V6_GLOV7|nr:DUF29 domain-containing protein [Gloeothece verrucosa]ADN16043.1 protein of unknown function DUF29 [Gloeothece verrucosa PCC 7822]
MQTYDGDFYQWTVEQAQALRQRDLDSLDWDNLIEEIESLGKSDYARVSSKVMRIIQHKLKIDYVAIPECIKHWQHEIKVWQKDIKRQISPSMIRKLLVDLDELFLDAKDLVLDEYDVELPQECPYSLDELVSSEKR